MYGVDYSQRLIEFAKKMVPQAEFSCQDATVLKFANNSFDVVFCRDLLHHLRQRKEAIKEMLRVCKPGGNVVLIESNGLNPLIFIWSIVNKAERDSRFITPRYLSALLKKYKITSWKYAEPFSLWRLIFHYKYGFSSIAKYRVVQKIYSAFDRLMCILIPKKIWTYMIIRLQK